MSEKNMERVLPSLAPNTTYVARVRSYNNLGVASAWSEALSFTTQNLPVNPGGGVGSFPTYTGTGTPEGVLTSDPGKSYQDTNTGAIYLKATGTGATGWTVIAGAPVDSLSSPPISGIYELPVGPFAGTALAGDAAVVSGQEIVLVEVGAPSINGSAKALVALVTGPSGSNVLSEVAIGAGDGSLTISDLSNGTTSISSDITIQTTAPTGGIQVSGPNLGLTATAGGIQFTSLGYGPVSIFAYTGNPNGNVTATSKGDLCVDTTTPGLWQASGVGTTWVAINGSSSTKTFQTSQTYSISGVLTVPSGASGYLPPFYVPVTSGQTATLTGVRHSLRAGSAGININHNGSSFSSITTTTTPTTSNFSIPVASDDTFAPVITSVSGADGLSMSFYFTITD